MVIDLFFCRYYHGEAATIGVELSVLRVIFAIILLARRDPLTKLRRLMKKRNFSSDRQRFVHVNSE